MTSKQIADYEQQLKTDLRGAGFTEHQIRVLTDYFLVRNPHWPEPKESTEGESA